MGFPWLMLIWGLCSFSSPVYSCEAYCTPRSEWCTPAGCGFPCCNTIRKADRANSASKVRPSAQPITRRENASNTTGRYTNCTCNGCTECPPPIHPWLIDGLGHHLTGQVRMYQQIVSRIGGHHEFRRRTHSRSSSRIIRSTHLWWMFKPLFRSSAVILGYP